MLRHNFLIPKIQSKSSSTVAVISPLLFADLANASTTAKATGAGSSKFVDPKAAKVDPKALPPPTLKEKVKKELWTVLKLNLVLVPILVAGSMFMYPPQDPKKEKEMMELYKKSAGWKT